MAPEERPAGETGVFRLPVTLRLDPARMRLISGFIDTYLRLNQQETLLFERQAATLLGDSEKTSVMELTTSWKEEGIESGEEKGMESRRPAHSAAIAKAVWPAGARMGGAHRPVLVRATRGFGRGPGDFASRKT